MHSLRVPACALALGLMACTVTSERTPPDAGPTEELADAGSLGVDASAPDTGPLTPPEGTTLTTVEFVDESGGTADRIGVPVTFAQVFAPGHVPAGSRVAGRIALGAGVPLQADVKAKHADGSLRHAVLTVRLPSLPAKGSVRVELVATTGAATADPPIDLAPLLAQGFDAEVALTLAGGTWKASAKELLQQATPARWLEGPLVTEWAVAAPLSNGASAHPHLAARFDVRAYGPSLARVDVVVENGWSYVAAPQNVTYDAAVTVGGQPAWSRAALEHHTHARWRRTLWLGEDPKVGVKLQTKYLLASGAVPHWDPALVPAESALEALAGKGEIEPMGIGLATAYMPQTGGRPDIGPAPSWIALYVLSMDARARRAMLAAADGAGSWPIHYRNEQTGRPVTLDEYPYMTLLGNPGDTYNPVTKKQEAFPACGGVCKSPYTPDSSHQPALVYVPYLVTGDRYYLEELQFWANWNLFQSNPGYRGAGKGLFKSDQVRGQAWSLRTLAEAAYVVPDADPQKANFTTRLQNNLQYWVERHALPEHDHALGIVTDGYAFAYSDGRGVAPWQDDFFTWAVGHAVELGFDQAKPLLAYKARFPIGRMVAPGYCWIDGAAYSLMVRDVKDGPLYTTFAQAWEATIGDPSNAAGKYREKECGSQAMADWLTARDGRTWKAGEMTGYSDSAEGYPSNMQPALAVAAGSGVAGAAEAWKRFIERPVKPDYAKEPQFAVVPR